MKLAMNFALAALLALATQAQADNKQDAKARVREMVEKGNTVFTITGSNRLEEVTKLVDQFMNVSVMARQVVTAPTADKFIAQDPALYAQYEASFKGFMARWLSKNISPDFARADFKADQAVMAGKVQGMLRVDVRLRPNNGNVYLMLSMVRDEAQSSSRFYVWDVKFNNGTSQLASFQSDFFKVLASSKDDLKALISYVDSQLLEN